MAKTGQPAFDSGMRGASKPKDKASGDGKRTGKVTRFEAEPSANGGFIHTVHRDGGSEPSEVGNYQGPEKHVHADKAAAVNHFSTMLDAMGGGEAAGAEKHEKGGKQATSANKGTGDK